MICRQNAVPKEEKKGEENELPKGCLLPVKNGSLKNVSKMEANGSSPPKNSLKISSGLRNRNPERKSQYLSKEYEPAVDVPPLPTPCFTPSSPLRS